jgi:conjugative relaxase-like TrwC/TraI family protein
MAWFRPIGADSVEYHRRTVLHRGDDHEGRALAYYGSRGETPLRWGGRLGERLGLAGPVDDAGYEAIFGPGGARDPHLGTWLVATRRPGVELVVAAHKTVAVLGLIGRADDLHAILDAETDATLAFLEEWFARQGGRRGKGQQRTATSGLLYARTRHATTRAGDPGPHDHVLVANLTEMLDDRGGWKALDTAGVRDLVHAATMAGRLAAAERAVELGYAIEPDAGPSGKLDHWAIAGIPPAVIEQFSKRSDEIEEELEGSGFDSYRARAIAARNSRAPKTEESHESLIARWLGELGQIGWPPRKINQRLRIVQERRHQPLRRLTEKERAERVRGLIGPGGPLAKRKAFTRPDVVRVAAPTLYGCAADELDHIVTGVLQHPEAIPLVGQPGARGRAWAAASVLATEQAVEAVAARLAERRAAAAVAAAKVEAAIAAKEVALGRELTEGQRRAATAIATSGRALDLVIGVAGSGKTTALEVVRTAFEAEGHSVLGTAISGQAARALREEAGVDSRTVASLVWRLEHGTLTLDHRTVLLLDEAGMADDEAMLKLLAAVDIAGAKAVVIGDHRQLGAVEPGGGLEALVNRRGDAVHVLDENIRQRDPGEREALEQLRSGDVAKAVEWYRDSGRVVTAPSRAEALDAAIKAWEVDVATGHEAMLMAWRRRDVAALNARVRQRRVVAGVVTGPEVEAPGGRRYAAGDRVVVLAPSGDGRLVTSERGTVVAGAGQSLTVQFDNGRQEAMAGEQLDSAHLDHAYAVTVHRMQGATVDRAHVVADGGGRELAYVAMSRARSSSHVYAVADDLDQAVDDLTAEWRVDHRRQWTIDLDHPADPGETTLPDLSRRPARAVRMAQLRAERDAIAAVAPDASGRLHALELSLRLDALQAERHRPGRGLGLA